MWKVVSIIVWIMHMHNAWQLPRGRIWHFCSGPGHGFRWWKRRAWSNDGRFYSGVSSISLSFPQHPNWPCHFLMWSSQQCALALFTLVWLQQNWRSALEIWLDAESGIRLLAFYPQPSFITANKGGLHRGLSSRLWLLSHTTCMEQPAIHM